MNRLLSLIGFVSSLASWYWTPQQQQPRTCNWPVVVTRYVEAAGDA